MVGRPSVAQRGGAARVPTSSPHGCHPYPGPPMSTRKLILAALLCGMAILLAFTLQIVLTPGGPS